MQLTALRAAADAERYADHEGQRAAAELGLLRPQLAEAV